MPPVATPSPRRKAPDPALVALARALAIEAARADHAAAYHGAQETRPQAEHAKSTRR